MTPERAEEIVGKLRQYRDVGVAMDIPALYAEMVAEQGWRQIGYESWDALCLDRLAGWRLALPREERKQAAVEMAESGMSTRAIGAALGVTHTTAQRDLDAGGTNVPPAPVAGLDGKTYSRPPKIEDAAPRPQAADASSQRLHDYVESDPDVRAARLRKRLSSFLARMHEPLPDPVELAGIAPDRAEDVMRAAAIVATFAEKYQSALPKPTHLRAVKES